MGKNRGEWSEFYVVLFLLDNPYLNIVDSKLQDLCNNLFIVEKLSVKEKENVINYILASKKEVQVFFNSILKNVVSKREIKKTLLLLKKKYRVQAKDLALLK